MSNFYERHYDDLRYACFRLLCHGVRYDREEAARKKGELEARKDIIKDELDKLTVQWDMKKQEFVPYKLYAENRHRSPQLITLLDKKRRLTEEKNAIPKEDKAGRKEKLAEIKLCAARIHKLRSEGGDVSVERGTGLSDARICTYLYEVLKLPPHRKKRKDTGKLTLTADDITLKKIKQSRPDLIPTLDLILEHRKANKLLGYLDEEKLDADGRLRSFYKPYGTQPGRLSSSETPLGTGTNQQNFDRSLKYLLIPDEG